MNQVVLPGCRRLPLADYLKALGVFTIIAEQHDASVRAAWSGDLLQLRGKLDVNGIVDFFATGYTPTPIVAPWNGGSGFYLKDTQDGIRAIERSTDHRFAPYREAIARCRDLVTRFDLKERPRDEQKHTFIEHLRASLPDHALHWMDAAVALEEDGPAFPPLLGTGGNDGRLDFSNNQMQRLAEVLLDSDGSRALLRASLFDHPAPNQARVAIGQFRPVSAGGANATEGFDRDSLVNPWDYILALEGSLIFAVAVSRRLESAIPGAASFPFTVRASGAGYGSAASTDEADARDEMWLPVWSRFAGYDEIRTVFGEGRATIGNRPARSGVDFARAIASLGTDRGIDSFTRIGFLVRNGLSYFATPLGDWRVDRVVATGLLAEIDDWLTQLGRAAGGKNAPAALRRAEALVDEAVLGLCRRGAADDVLQLLLALGCVEAVSARSPSVRAVLRPLPSLRQQWLEAADDGSIELRLAACLASGGIREYLSLARHKGRSAGWGTDDGTRVWSQRSIIDNMIAVARRREATGGWPSLDSDVSARPADVAEFIAGKVDDERLDSLIWAVCSIDYSSGANFVADEQGALPALFAIARLALTRQPLAGLDLPHTRGVLARLAAGDAVAATRSAERRLLGAGLVPRCGSLAASRDTARRTAAALLFPLDSRTTAAMRRQIIRTTSLEDLHHATHRP